jgi:hypothetical protein
MLGRELVVMMQNILAKDLSDGSSTIYTFSMVDLVAVQLSINDKVSILWLVCS